MQGHESKFREADQNVNILYGINIDWISNRLQLFKCNYSPPLLLEVLTLIIKMQDFIPQYRNYCLIQ